MEYDKYIITTKKLLVAGYVYGIWSEDGSELLVESTDFYETRYDAIKEAKLFIDN